LDALVVRVGKQVIGRYPLGRQTVVILGRGGDIVLNSPHVSRHHAAVRPVGEQSYVITDLGSKSGTKVNGAPVPALGTTLKHGDTIEVEEFAVRCVIGAAGDEKIDPRALAAYAAVRPKEEFEATVLGNMAVRPPPPPEAMIDGGAAAAAPRPAAAEPPPRTLKEIQGRIELTYYRKPHPLRRALRTGWIAAAAASVIWIAVVEATGAHATYNSGPVSASHAAFASRCELCHTDAFKTVPDAACLACHDGLLTPAQHAERRDLAPAEAHRRRFPTHHPDRREAPECSSCHIEHKGEAFLVEGLHDGHCARCHGALTPAAEPRVVSSAGLGIESFARGHPEFGPLAKLDKFPPGSSAALAPGGRDQAAIKLDHQLHLTKLPAMDTPARKAWLARTGRDALVCADCHTPDAAGAYMRPVEFDRHCRECHSIEAQLGPIEEKKETLARTIALPHGRSPRELAAKIEGERLEAEVRRFFERYIAAHPEELAPAAVPTAATAGRPGPPMPGARPPPPKPQAAAAPVSPTAWVEGRMSRWEKPLPPRLGGARDVERALFQGCEKCHAFTSGASGAEIVPPAIPARWLPASVFSHDRHQVLACASCHAAAWGSKETADVLLPGIASCRECHKDGGARTRCSECHLYHERRDQRAFDGAMTIDAISAPGGRHP
jgi:hypothetical protein